MLNTRNKKLAREKGSRGSAIIELVIILPFLLLCVCWAIELVEQINALNQAISLSKETANYVFRECSTMRDLQMSDCMDRIQRREMSNFASQYDTEHRSHVAVSVYYRNETNPNTINEYHGSSGNAEFPPEGGRSLRFADNCRRQGVFFGNNNLPVNRIFNNDRVGNNHLVTSVVVAQAYIFYEPMFGGLAKLAGVHDGPHFICDTTII